MHRHARIAAGLVVLAHLLRCAPALAVDPSSYLISPTVTRGEREIDLRAGVGSAGRTTGFLRAVGLGLGMGVNDNWFTEIAVQYHRNSRSGLVYDAVEWENTVSFAEPNEWPVDVGMALEIELPRESGEGASLRMGPLLQKDFGNFEANLNILLDRHYGSTYITSTQVQYQGQIRYRYSRPFEFGLQAFGNLGDRRQSWTAYELQSHRVGPVVLGHFPLPAERGLSYNIAYLVGTTAHSPDRTIRFELECDF
jgi:hypothetical protein